MTAIKESLDQLMSVDGALAAAVVDYGSGMLLGAAGGGIDLELAAGGNTEVMRSKLKTMQMLGLDDTIDDILITLGKQYHLIRPLARAQDLFAYYVLDKSRANLALSRRKLAEVGDALEV
ncbi:hypothetical protein [Pseudomonas oryzae]|uniref:Roadblock/LC7 domain-containing protein n=1 Tax=Pseudomonas oryzae TaxID=1392877 RepID=A0A1H1TUW2_9PSED|nr:hypothetical protein [Pseudomonas oryzae]SDS63988.1 hypothetical protein SAMN05216221_2268 [Pseudomonas oryzae]